MRLRELHRRTVECCIGVLVLAASGCRTVGTGLAEGDQKLLCLDPGMVEVLGKCTSKGLLEVAPVVLPEGENLLGVNDHFGWPIATMSGDTIIVFFYRKPAHWGGKDKPDKYSSSCVTVRSLDGGRTWSEPVSLATFIKTKTQGCKAGFGNAAGTLPHGTVVCITSDGVFRSRDQGATWEYLPGAFGGDQLKGPRTNMGPRLIVHPTYGLVAAGHDITSPRPKKGPPTFPSNIWIRWSTDAGETWHEACDDLPDFAVPIEPALFMHDGAMLVLARSHGKDAYDPEKRVWRYTQLYSQNGWMPFTASLTNIPTSQLGDSPWQGPWSQDTVEVSFNPVSARIEAVLTNRTGGGPGYEHPTNQQTINLWSISPAELAAGSSEWRFEGTLLRREGPIGVVDGMHPAGGVVDAKRGVAHTFVYCGFPTGPSGIFRVTRSLNTKALSKQLLELPAMTVGRVEEPAKVKPCGLRMLFIHPATPAGMEREWYEPPAEGTGDAASNYVPWFERLGLDVTHVHTREEFDRAWATRTKFDVVTIADHAWKRDTWLQEWVAESAAELRAFVCDGGALVTEVGRDDQEKPLADLLQLKTDNLPASEGKPEEEAAIDVVQETPFARWMLDTIDTRHSDNSLATSCYLDPLPEWAQITVCRKAGQPVVVAGHLGKGLVVASTAEILNPANFGIDSSSGDFREQDLLQFWSNLLLWVRKER